MSVSLRYELKRLCDMLSWSVSLRYHLIYCYDIWYVAKTCQIGLSYSCTSYVMLTSQHGLQRPDLYETYMKRRYDFTCRVGKVTSKNDQEKYLWLILRWKLINIESTFSILSLIWTMFNNVKTAFSSSEWIEKRSAMSEQRCEYDYLRKSKPRGQHKIIFLTF